jgi:hypothetical protein
MPDPAPLLEAVLLVDDDFRAGERRLLERAREAPFAPD